MTQHEHERAASLQEEMLERVRNAGYARLIGMRILTAEGGIGKASIAVDERLMHPQMIVHGGVVFTLADTAMSMAVLSVYPPGTRFSTIEAKINFLAPTRTGELIAEATILHQGRSTMVLEASVFNSVEGKNERKLVARMLGTFSISLPKTDGSHAH